MNPESIELNLLSSNFQYAQQMFSERQKMKRFLSEKGTSADSISVKWRLFLFCATADAANQSYLILLCVRIQRMHSRCIESVCVMIFALLLAREFIDNYAIDQSLSSSLLSAMGFFYHFYFNKRILCCM